MLIVGPSWVGDMVMAQSLFKTVQRKNPGVEIDVLAPAWSIPILERMAEVNASIEMALGHGEFGLMQRYRLGLSLRSRRYDRAIVTPRSLKSALPPFFAGIPQRTGYRGEMRYGLINDMRPLDKNVLRQTVQRYVALGLAADEHLPPAQIPQPLLQINRQHQQQLVSHLALTTDRPVIAMMPGAEYGPAKCWPVAHYRELAQRLGSAGYQVWLFGSKKDRTVSIQISDGLSHVVNLAGRTELADVVDLIALAQLAVTNDSGLMHVAAAAGCAVIAIYGSSTPAYTPPLSDRANVLYLDLACSPCFERECPKGDLACLKKIRVDDVMRVIEQHHV